MYTLVENKDTTSFSCMWNCTYEMTTKPGSRYCFTETGSDLTKCA